MSPSFPPDAAEPARLLLLVLAKSTFVLGAAAFGAWSLRRASAARRHLAWSLALAALLALPVLSALLPAWKPGFLAVVAPSAPGAAVAAAPAPASLWRFASLGGAPGAAPAAEGGAPWGAILLGAWALGAALVLARLAIGLFGLSRMARAARPVTDPAWTALVARLAAGAGIRAPVRLLRASGAAMPMTWGLFRPVVLLPESADAWDADKRRAVLLHELAHVARRDCFVQALATVACALYWFHPGAWWAAARMRVEREQACDDAVLGAGARASDYARHLLDVARAFPAPRAAAAAVAMARPSRLEDRVVAVLEPGRDRSEVTRTTGAVCAGAALLALLPLAVLSPSEREPGEGGARRKVAVVVPVRGEIRAGSASGTASVETRVDDLDIRVDVRYDLTVGAGGGVAPAEPAPATTAPARPGPDIHFAAQRTPPPPPPAPADDDDGEALAELIRASSDADPAVRRIAVLALGRVGEEAVVEPLAASLHDPDAEVRAMAADALGRLASRHFSTAGYAHGGRARRARPSSDARAAALALDGRAPARAAHALRVAGSAAEGEARTLALRVLDEIGAGADPEMPTSLSGGLLRFGGESAMDAIPE